MKDFFAAIDTPGGHIVVCFFLIGVGAMFHRAGLPTQGDLVFGQATAVIFKAMVGQNGGRVTVTAPPPKADTAP